jgi:hypothetical protein
MIGKDVKTRTRVRWSADEKRMYFDGRGLDIRRWKKFVRDLVDMAEEMLSKRLLFESNIPMVDLNITDNPDKSNTGHYFLLDENNAFTKRREGMLRRLQQSGKWEDMIENKGDELPVVTPEKRGFSGFLYGGPLSPNPKKRVISGQNYVGFLGHILARLT